MNVFLVLTPLQLINAREAKEFFGTLDNTLIVLRHTTVGYPVSMFKRLIEDGDWDRIYFLSTYDDESVLKVNIPYYTLLSRRQRKRLDALAASLGTAQGLFIGQDHEPMARHLSNVLPYETLYLIDDGTYTLETNNERKQPVDSRTGFEKLKAAVKSRIIGWNNDEAERVTFFTAYDIDPRPGDAVVPNRYVHFRRRIANAAPNGEVWFLGGPLTLDGYVTDETYLRYLSSARRYYGEKRFVYLPHSREQDADVERVRAALGCEVRHSGLPVELALSRAQGHPEHVVSFISSALHNLHVMFGPKLQLASVYLEPELFLHPYLRDEAESIYRYYRGQTDTNFELLTLTQLEGARPPADAERTT